MPDDNDISTIDQSKIGPKNVDKLRKPHELPHHWELRRDFLLLHAGKFDFDRLICLSNVFVNVECLGVKYPGEVMKLVKELGLQVKSLEAYKYNLEKNDSEPRRKQAPQRRQYS